MKITDVVKEDITRRGFLQGAGAAAVAGAAGKAGAGQYKSVTDLNKDPAQLQQVWKPRVTELTARCYNILKSFIVATRQTKPEFAKVLQGIKVEVTLGDSRFNQGNAGSSQVQTQSQNGKFLQVVSGSGRVILEATVFWDAPDNTLAFVLGHECGHIIMQHNANPSSKRGRDAEIEADTIGAFLAKDIGYNSASLFQFLFNQKAELLRNGSPNDPHLEPADRVNFLKQKADFELSNNSIRYIDSTAQHFQQVLAEGSSFTSKIQHIIEKNGQDGIWDGRSLIEFIQDNYEGHIPDEEQFLDDIDAIEYEDDFFNELVQAGAFAQGLAEGMAQDEAEETNGWRAELVNQIKYNTFEVKMTNTRSKESANFIVRPVDMISIGPTLQIETMDVHDLQTGQTASWTSDDPQPDGGIVYAIAMMFWDNKELQKKLWTIVDQSKDQDLMPGLNQRRSIGQEVDADAYIDSQEKTQDVMAKMKQGNLKEFAPIKPPTAGAFGGNKDYGQPTSSRYLGNNKFVLGTTNNYVLTATVDKWGLEWDEDDEIWFLDSPGAVYIADATEGEIELPAPQEQRNQIHDLVSDYLNARNSAELQRVAAYYGHSADGEMATSEGYRVAKQQIPGTKTRAQSAYYPTSAKSTVKKLDKPLTDQELARLTQLAGIKSK